MLGNFLQQMTFSDALFFGALRVQLCLYCSCVIIRALCTVNDLASAQSDQSSIQLKFLAKSFNFLHVVSADKSYWMNAQANLRCHDCRLISFLLSLP